MALSLGRVAQGDLAPGPPDLVAFRVDADGIRQAGTSGDPEQWRSSWDRCCTRDEQPDAVPNSAIQLPHPGCFASATWPPGEEEDLVVHGQPERDGEHDCYGPRGLEPS